MDSHILAPKLFTRKICSILFFLPLSSICDNQVQLSSDESLFCTIPVLSFSDSRFLICTCFPKIHQMGCASLIIEFHPISNRIPEYRHFEDK